MRSTEPGDTILDLSNAPPLRRRARTRYTWPEPHRGDGIMLPHGGARNAGGGE